LYTRIVKPFFDHLFSFTILVLASPVLLICMVMLAIANRGKVWFTQPRPGKHGKIFTVVKFKTMNDARDANGKLLPDEKRLTAMGKFIRKTSLDELPQLINVLKGDMSFVGPRPLLVECLPLYDAEQARRHDVKPGITGWAQVNGWRGETPDVSWMEKRVQHDLEYIEKWSLLWDLKIIFLTIAGRKKARNAY